MQAHEHFEELCTLAVLGQLDQAEYSELTKHLGSCEICRSAYRDFSEVANSILPFCDRAQHPSFQISSLPAHDELRQKFLCRARAEGCAISDDAMAHHRFTWRVRLPRIAIPRLITAIALAGVIAGVGLLWRANQPRRVELEGLEGTIAALRARLAAQHDTTQQALADLGTKRMNDAELGLKLHEAEARVQALDRALQEVRAERSRLQYQLAQELTANSELGQKAAFSDRENKTLRSQVQELHVAGERRASETVALEYRIAELSEQIRDQGANLARTKELLSAGREIRDLMGARNLHIIDVQDVSVGGKQQPYGRIFLTEGKSLIFFAYDLEKVASRNASFQAWGQREDGSRKTASLGILAVDDTKQSRWLLKVEDPKLLSEIDSVFVTVEPAGGGTKPAGKKLLYAYLRNPINHP